MPAIADKVPDTTVMITTTDGPGPVSSAELLGSGTRSERYVAIIRDGVITSPDVGATFVEHRAISAEAVLARL